MRFYGVRCFLVSLLTLPLFFKNIGAQTREQVIEAAKAERVLYWYGSMSNDDASPLINALAKKYPFLEIRRYRGDNPTVLNKLYTEARARSLSVDIIDINGLYVIQLLERNFLIPYLSPESVYYPKEAKDPDGLWYPFHLLPMAVIYNTKLVPPEQAPTSYSDLLDTKWKDRLAIEKGGIPWYFGMLQHFGEDEGRRYMKKLAGQNPRVQPGNREMVEMTVAGELQVSIGAYAHRIGQYQKKGAPMGWMSNDVIPTIMQVFGISRYGKSPNASKLVVDFLLSTEGQTFQQKLGRIPANPKVEPDPPEIMKGRKILFLDIIKGGKHYNELDKEFRQTFDIH